jgi:hypothetical protein
MTHSRSDKTERYVCAWMMFFFSFSKLKLFRTEVHVTEVLKTPPLLFAYRSDFNIYESVVSSATASNRMEQNRLAILLRHFQLTTFIYSMYYIRNVSSGCDRLCDLVVRVFGYRSRGPGSIPGTTRKKSSGSSTGSTQPREYNWGATWKEK